MQMLAKENNTQEVKESMSVIKDFASRYKPYGVGPTLVQLLDTVKQAKDTQIAGATGDEKAQLATQSKDIADAMDAIGKI